MSRYSVLLLGFLLSLQAVSQSFDQTIASNRYIDCRDVFYNAARIVKPLYENEEYDSLYRFADYWEKKCGELETTHRLRLLLDIRTGKFSGDSLRAEVIDYMVSYRQRLDEINSSMDEGSMMGNDLMGTAHEYDKVLQRMAILTQVETRDEKLLIDFYGHENPDFSSLSREDPADSKLRLVYDKVIDEMERLPKLHMALNLGIVDHFGEVDLFGLRADIGISYGIRHLRHNYDLVFNFKPGPSPAEYTVMYQGNQVTQNTWTGMYLGFEYTYDFVDFQNISIGLSPGLGLDRITALTIDNEYGEDAYFLPSFNANSGLVFKFRFGKRGGYLGLHARYHWVDYKNPGGTPLKGNYFTLRMSAGSIFNEFQDRRLRLLQ